MNPYESPAAEDVSAVAQNRTLFVLAAAGAWLASAYWAALTLLIAVGVATGSVSALQVIMPCVLIGLYAIRGVQIFRGDAAAATRILWLHGIGCLFALQQATSTHGFLAALHGIKVAIHIFGGVTAFLASRSPTYR